jgi:tetratricopeptide (TPR) repeat protein
MTRPPLPPVLPGLGSKPASGPAAQPVFDVETLLSSAIQAHNAGRQAEAERGYRALAKIAPSDARVPAHLAVLLMEQGRHDDALAALDRTLALDSRQAGMLTNKGNVLVALGRFPEALAAYGQAIVLQPEGERAAAHINLGVYLQGLGRPDDAAAAYGKAIALDARFPEAWGNLGSAHLNAGRPEAALEALDRAVELRPAYADAWTNRGTALQALGRLDEALQSFDRALALHPESAGVWSNRSLALQGLRRFEESFEASAKAVELAKSLGGAEAESWNNHGVALGALNRSNEALAAYDKALSADPAGASAWNNRGLALHALGRPDEALASYDRAMALKPDYADPYWNKALSLLALGRYAEGWPLFEWRWKRSEPGAQKPQDFGAPPWLGETSLEGKTLLIHAEQGYGDTLQMLRYVPVLAGQGVRVALICPEPLLELADTVQGLAEPARSGGRVDFDAHIPAMSLPLAMNTTLDTVPADVPYLAVPEPAKAAWAKKDGIGRLGETKRLRVGLSWSGNPGHRNDHNRSLPFAALAPLLGADAEFHSLQKDYRPGDRDALRAAGVIDHSAELNSFSDTAALIDRMDLVLAVDTATAHLAGALGKRLLVLLPFAPDFRWGLNRSDTPWYPTATLLRQSKPGGWGPVVAEAARALGIDRGK